MTEDNRPVNLKAFAHLPADQPVVMINLLKFNDTGGVDSYRRYGVEVQPHLERVGGRVVYSGGNPWAVIGDDERPWWDSSWWWSTRRRRPSSTWSPTPVTRRF